MTKEEIQAETIRLWRKAMYATGVYEVAYIGQQIGELTKDYPNARIRFDTTGHEIIPVVDFRELSEKSVDTDRAG